jgi:hypothetical protein
MNVRSVFIANMLVFVSISCIAAGDLDSEPGFIHLQIDEVEFQPDPEVPGLQFSILAGDPGKPGPYVIRARFGPGMTSPPHDHDQDRFVSVISGE